MFNTSIRSLVKREINAIVDQVQKKFDDRVAVIEANCEKAKMLAREEAVESIMSKFR